MSKKKVLPAVSVAMVRGETLLLVRRGRAPSKGMYAYPGGRVEPGESLDVAARRELMEETGLTVDDLRPHALYEIEGETADYSLQVFSGRHAGGEPVAADDAEAAGFFRLDEIAALPVPESVLEVARQLLAPDRT